MINLIRSEFRKLRTTQVWFWLLIASVGLTAFLVIVQLATRNDLGDPKHVREVFTSAQTAFIPAFILGILAVTTEFRHQTITPTLLATPSRWRLVGAKLISNTLVGAIYALACVIIAVVVGVPWLNAKSDAASIGDSNIWTALLGIFISVILYALLGIGFGALIKNQIAAISIGLVYNVLIEGLLSTIPGVRVIYPYIPGGASQAIVTPHSEYNGHGYHVLAAGGGVVILIVWGLGLALLGAGITMNRDIT